MAGGLPADLADPLPGQALFRRPAQGRPAPQPARQFFLRRADAPGHLARPAAQLQQGILLGEVLEVARQVREQHDRLGLMAAGRLHRAQAGKQHRMQHHAAEARVLLMAVRFPVAAAQVDLDIPAHPATSHAQFRA